MLVGATVETLLLVYLQQPLAAAVAVLLQLLVQTVDAVAVVVVTQTVEVAVVVVQCSHQLQCLLLLYQQFGVAAVAHKAARAAVV